MPIKLKTKDNTNSKDIVSKKLSIKLPTKEKLILKTSRKSRIISKNSTSSNFTFMFQTIRQKLTTKIKNKK